MLNEKYVEWEREMRERHAAEDAEAKADRERFDELLATCDDPLRREELTMQREHTERNRAHDRGKARRAEWGMLMACQQADSMMEFYAKREQFVQVSYDEPQAEPAPRSWWARLIAWFERPTY